MSVVFIFFTIWHDENCVTLEGDGIPNNNVPLEKLHPRCTMLQWYGNIAAMAAVENGHGSLKGEEAKTEVTLNYRPPNRVTTSKYHSITQSRNHANGE